MRWFPSQLFCGNLWNGPSSHWPKQEGVEFMATNNRHGNNTCKLFFCNPFLLCLGHHVLAPFNTLCCISCSWNYQRGIIFRQQNRLLAILVKQHRSRRFTRTDLSCSDLLSVCLSLYPCVFLRSSLIHAQQTSHKMLYRVHEARKKFTPRSSFENQKSSTESQYATRTFKGPRKRDLLTREKLLLHRRGHRHRMAPPRVRRTRAHSNSWARGNWEEDGTRHRVERSWS